MTISSSSSSSPPMKIRRFSHSFAVALLLLAAVAFYQQPPSVEAWCPGGCVHWSQPCSGVRLDGYCGGGHDIRCCVPNPFGRKKRAAVATGRWTAALWGPPTATPNENRPESSPAEASDPEMVEAISSSNTRDNGDQDHANADHLASESSSTAVGRHRSKRWWQVVETVINIVKHAHPDGLGSLEAMTGRR